MNPWEANDPVVRQAGGTAPAPAPTAAPWEANDPIVGQANDVPRGTSQPVATGQVTGQLQAQLLPSVTKTGQQTGQNRTAAAAPEGYRMSDAASAALAASEGLPEPTEAQQRVQMFQRRMAGAGEYTDTRPVTFIDRLVNIPIAAQMAAAKTFTSAAKGLGLLTDMATGRPSGTSGFTKAGESAERWLNSNFAEDQRLIDSWVSSKIPGAGGSMASFVAATFASAGSSLLPVAAPAIVGALVQASNEYDRAVAEGKSEDEANRRFVLNLGVGATEAVPLLRILHRGGQSAVKQVTLGIVEEMMQGGGVEAAANKIAGRPVMEGVPEAAALEGIAGGMLAGGVAGAHKAQGVARRRQMQQNLDAFAAMVEQQAQAAPEVFAVLEPRARQQAEAVQQAEPAQPPQEAQQAPPASEPTPLPAVQPAPPEPAVAPQEATQAVAVNETAIREQQAGKVLTGERQEASPTQWDKIPASALVAPLAGESTWNELRRSYVEKVAEQKMREQLRRVGIERIASARTFIDDSTKAAPAGWYSGQTRESARFWGKSAFEAYANARTGASKTLEEVSYLVKGKTYKPPQESPQPAAQEQAAVQASQEAPQPVRPAQAQAVPAADVPVVEGRQAGQVTKTKRFTAKEMDKRIADEATQGGSLLSQAYDIMMAHQGMQGSELDQSLPDQPVGVHPDTISHLTASEKARIRKYMAVGEDYSAVEEILNRSNPNFVYNMIEDALGGDKVRRERFEEHILENIRNGKPNAIDPEVELMIYLKSKWAEMTTEERRIPRKEIDVSQLRPGAKVTMHGEVFTVEMQDGFKVLADGVTIPADALETVPAEKVVQPKVAKSENTSGQQMGLTGVGPAGAMDGGITGPQKALFSTEKQGKSRADLADEAFRATQTARDPDTGEMFPAPPTPGVADAALPEPPGETLPGGRESGATTLVTGAADELAGVVHRIIRSTARATSNTAQIGKRLVMRGTDYMETLGASGKALAKDIRDISRSSSKSASNDLEDMHAVLKGMSVNQIETMAKFINRYVDTVPAWIKQRADRTVEIMDRAMDEASKLGLTRVVQGARIPIGGSGQAVPQVPNARGVEFLERASNRGMSDVEVAKYVAELVRRGQFKSEEDALNALRLMHEERLRGTNRYLESERVKLPEEYVDFNLRRTLPHLIERNWLLVEGVRRWGPELEGAMALAEKTGMEFGDRAIAAKIERFIQHAFGLPGDVTTASKQLAGFASNYQTFVRLGGSMLSALRNAGQRYTNLTDIPLGIHLSTSRQYPPFINPFVKSARKLAEKMRRTGAVRARTELTALEDVPGEKITRLSMIPFGKVEQGNQTYSAIAAGKAIEYYVNRLMALDKAGRLKRFLNSAVNLQVSSKAASERALHRLGMTDEQIHAAITSGKPLTEDQVEAAMHKLSLDTQFALTLDTQPLWWQTSPWMRLMWKFKTFGLRQTGMIYNNVVKESFKGNPRPLMRFVFWTMLMGEIYNVVRDLLTEREESVTKRLLTRPDTRNPQDIAVHLLKNMGDGGGVGILADVIYGLGDFIAGPMGSTLRNLKLAAMDSWQRPSRTPQAMKAFLTREISLTRQTTPLLADLDRMAFNPDNDYRNYTRWRMRSYEHKDQKERPTPWSIIKGAVTDAIGGRTEYERTDRTFTYDMVARQITAGDVEDAAELLRPIIAEADDKDKILTAIRASMTAKAPLGAVSRADVKNRDAMLNNENIAEFLAKFTQEQQEDAIAVHLRWLKRYRTSIEKAQ